MSDFNWEILVIAAVFFIISLFATWGINEQIEKDRKDGNISLAGMLVFVVSFILLWVGYGIAAW